MSQYFVVHPVNPQTRLINQAVGILRQGGIIVYPTDSGYALERLRGDRAGNIGHHRYGARTLPADDGVKQRAAFIHQRAIHPKGGHANPA